MELSIIDLQIIKSFFSSIQIKVIDYDTNCKETKKYKKSYLSGTICCNCITSATTGSRQQNDSFFIYDICLFTQQVYQIIVFH